MWTLTGFADEISPELDEQLDTIADQSIGFVELRSVWNKNVLDLTDDEVEKVGGAMSERGIGVSSIGSPIGKVPIAEDFAPHLESSAGRCTSRRYWKPRTSGSSLSSCRRGRIPPYTGMRYWYGWAPWQRRPRHAGSSSCTRTRRKSTGTSRAVAWTS